AGPACHTHEMSCFGSVALGADAIARLDQVIAQRANGKLGMTGTPSYTRELLENRNKRLKKIGEESAELNAACADADRERAAEEAADEIYHTLVALRALGVGLAEVREALQKRTK